jgi:hypothetical protein
LGALVFFGDDRSTVGGPGLRASGNPEGIGSLTQGCLPSEVLLTKEGEATLGKSRGPNPLLNPEGIESLSPATVLVLARVIMLLVTRLSQALFFGVGL